MSCSERQIRLYTLQSAAAEIESSSRPHFPRNRMFWSRAARVWIPYGTEQPPRREDHARSELTKLKSGYSQDELPLVPRLLPRCSNGRASARLTTRLALSKSANKPRYISLTTYVLVQFGYSGL